MKLKFIPYILFFLLAASCQEKGSKPDTIKKVFTTDYYSIFYR